jgi:hypothetical protein
MNEQTWTSTEIKELLEFTQELRKQNADYKSMIIASDAMIRNKEAQIKNLKLKLYEAITNRNSTILE